MAPAGVTFHGAVDVNRALEIVAAADVFVMPSVEMADGRRDGIPVALMEAMAIGVPVVASDVSGIPELVHDGSTGLLVLPGDAIGLADAIERLIDDRSLRDQLTDAGRRKIEQEFDLESTGRAMARIFQSSGGVPDPASSRSDVGGTAPASHRRTA
jgi:glycosyltransferase involved in cell wall biosynthesis